MSEIPVGNPPAPEANGEKSVSYESFQKVLGEKKHSQKQLEEMKARLDQYEQDKLEAEGKVKESNENLKKLLAQSKEEKAKLAQTVQNKVIYAQFAREAEKLGCLNTKLAYGAIDLSDVDVTEDLELDQIKLKDKLSTLTRDMSYLFKKDVNMPNDINPGGKIQTKPLSDMSEKELVEMLKTAK